MRCTSCGSENPEKRFCGDCGLPLGSRCARCGVENPAGKKFCGDCGADLSQPTAAPRPAQFAGTPVVGEHSEPLEVPEGERRHLTVLFCDLVGSTEIARHLDPEEWREIVSEYHRAAAQAIERFGGHVAQYLGDGVMACFGYPEAHDNDAERAARAGLAILDAISKLNEHPMHPKLSELPTHREKIEVTRHDPTCERSPVPVGRAHCPDTRAFCPYPRRTPQT
jgi:hypothetical protein